jgi:hypothetical protein
VLLPVRDRPAAPNDFRRNKAFGPPPKKMAVFTLVDREGRARSRHVADVTAKTLRPAIVRNADRKSWPGEPR